MGRIEYTDAAAARWQEWDEDRSGWDERTRTTPG